MPNDFFLKTQNPIYLTPMECLEETIEDYKKQEMDAYKGKKCMTIALNEDDGGYSIAVRQSGMSKIEVVGLLEFVKSDMAS